MKITSLAYSRSEDDPKKRKNPDAVRPAPSPLGLAALSAGGGGGGTSDVQSLLDNVGNTQGEILFRGATEWKVLSPDTTGKVLQTNGAGADPSWVTVSGAGLGDVSGPASSTDNAISRYDGTTGKNIQNSTITIDDFGMLGGSPMTGIYGSLDPNPPVTSGLVSWYGNDWNLPLNQTASTWSDKVGGNHAYRSSIATRPFYRKISNTLPPSMLSAVEIGASFNLPTTLSFDVRSFTIVMLGRWHGHAGQKVLCAIGDGAPGVNFYHSNAADLRTFATAGGGGNVTATIPANPTMIAFAGDSSNLTFWVENTSINTTALTAATAVGGIISESYATGATKEGDLFDVLIFNRKLNSTEMGQLWTWAQSKLQIQTYSTSAQIAFVGDSLTLGWSGGTLPASGGAFNYPQQVMAALPKKTPNTIRYYNVSTGGETINNFPAMTNLYSGSFTKNIAVVWGGTNDLFGGASAATVISRWQTYCNTLKTAGWHVIMLTIPKRTSGGTPGAYAADSITVNNDIIANYATYANDYIDIRADSRLNDSTNTTYVVDGIHLTLAGYSVVAELVRNKLATIL